MKIVIIEDEPLASKELKRSINEIVPEAEVIETLPSIKKAVNWFKSNPEPDLIFTDIQLEDGHSFEIFSEVHPECPLIFTTAYDAYAIKAFKLNSIDYLLKPICEDDLENALLKYKKQTKNQNDKFDINILSQLVQSPNTRFKKHFLARVGDQYKQIPTENIAYFYAEGNTVYLVTTSKQKVIIDHSLDDLMEYLDPVNFYRVSRKFIIQNVALKGIHKYFNARLKLELVPDVKEEVIVSRARVSEFLQWLDQ